MAIFWTTLSGNTLTTLDERVTTTYALPIKSEYLPLSSNNMTISLVSGSLPKGMRLSGENIVGTPLEVTRDTLYTFVVRAEQHGVIDDRTYSIIVTGADDPVWTTPADLLPVGPNDTFYIIDSAPLDFQLIATDTDLSAGDSLEYYIQEGDGELPPGITLTTDGRLVGVVEPILALDASSGSGKYDSNNFGNYPFDFGIRPDNGFDSFFYDTTIYDLSVPTRSPRKLNRFYEFIVSVNDGDTIARRKFKIYVVGDDFVRADNTVMEVDTGVFTADNTFIRVPLWLTPRDFGIRRANNYVTLFLDVLDTNELLGVITYTLQEINDDGSVSILPEGLHLDGTTGEIAGRVPYQPSVTKEYKFTVKASRFGPTTTRQYVTLQIHEDTATGASVLKVSKNSDIAQLVGRQIVIDERSYTITKADTTVSTAYDEISLGETITVTCFESALPNQRVIKINKIGCLLYTSPSPRDS